MPMITLSEEKVLELERQMLQKKQEHDQLEKKHHFALWEEDLDQFMVALDKHELKEEQDRNASNQIKVGQKPKKAQKTPTTASGKQSPALF